MDPALAEYTSLLSDSSMPIAVAVATLAVCAPAVARTGTDYEHWGLTHLLLDGHHKLQAAAKAGRPLRLLQLPSLDASLAQPDQTARIPRLRTRPPLVAPRADVRWYAVGVGA